MGYTLLLTGVLAVSALSSLGAHGAVQTTRAQTVRPLAVPADTQPLLPKEVSRYKTYGYSAWQWGPGEDHGRRFDLMPPGYRGATNAARLLSFFSLSDVHLTDKESPAQVPYLGWSGPFQGGGVCVSAYSPSILSTTHVLDAAVKTINALHRESPFNFGIVLGDVCNCAQYNELRWFIDTMDGKRIEPSSGAHLGANSVAYQKPFQAAGLDRSIPWYQVIGNHDQFWMGMAFPTDKIRATLVGGNVLNMGPDPLAPDVTERTGLYSGVVDGTTRYGEVVKGGPINLFAHPPTVAPDPARRMLTTVSASGAVSCTNFMAEFFHTTSLPKGHGFQPANLERDSACYSFEPTTNLPLKIIVLDDTCKRVSLSGGPVFYAGGWLDAARYGWLTNQLQQGQDAGQLMVLACHVPVLPQEDLAKTNQTPQQFYITPRAQTDPQFAGEKTETELLTTLHHYPNLILVMAGHRHMNTVTPQPSPDPAHPEYGFWEVETPSLRDFPQQFRTWQLLRNSDNTISIKTTDVDPQANPGSLAFDSRGYALGVERVLGVLPLGETSPHVYNAELIKPLTSAMQKKLAAY